MSGNRCPRGEIYGREEMLSPRRVVTATVRTDAEEARRLPVKTTAALPREWIDELLAELYRMEVRLPIGRGEVIIPNVKGSGIDVVATRTFRRSTVERRD